MVDFNVKTTFFFLLLIVSQVTGLHETIVPGGDWRDTDGNLVATTEGGFLQVGDTFYLWGMDRSADNYEFVAVNCYSSTDMKNWKFENKILKKSTHADLDGGVVVERAKILHNENTGQFVMWMHYEGHDAYTMAHVAYATSSSITEEFTFHDHFRPLKSDIDSRDLNVYKDDDGKAYLICSTVNNSQVRIFLLDDTYTGIVKEVFCGYASNGMECEGHGIIKSDGTYFWLMSLCTGWDFNDNHYFYARSLEGPWEKGGKIATSNTHTYESQVGFTLTLRGSKQTAFIFMGDRWSTRNFGKTRLVLLPIVTNGTSLSVPWYDEWNLDAKTGEWSPCAKKFINNNYTITAKHSGLVLGIKSGSNDVVQQKPDGSENQIWNIENRGASHFKITNVASGKSFDVSDESREPGAKLLQWDWKDSYNQKWHIIDCGEGYHRFVSVNTLGKTIEIENSSKTVEASVVLGNFDYKDNQLWQMTAVNPDIVSGSTYMIENRESGKVLDAGSVTGSSDTVIQSSPLEKAGQVWELNDLYNGYYTFTLPNRSQALDNSYKIEEGAYVTTADSDEKKYAQQWQIVKVTDNYYKIINRFSGKVLDNRNGSYSEGNPVIQYSDNASESINQQWKFIPADPVKTKSIVNINSNKNTVIYSTIYDLNGKVLKQKYMNSSKMLAKSGLPGGVYLVKASQNGKVIFHRILHTD